ncbi:uncharacterized protein LOC113295077 [Papaver somniferum]|uniref:uncharacterized protein LOC113295077 n=1 Tax=Papaver somniferum TaxID=3469 RepID=UPI000E6F8533|nr:uncharacterized protein LOC113295077 [Papaver somniferum]
MHNIVTQLQASFPIKDLGNIHYFLGLEVKRDNFVLHLSQSKYALDLLKKNNMTGAKACSSPASATVKLSKSDGTLFPDPSEYRSIVGALQYLTWTRPDICYAVNQVCQFMQNPTTTHFEAFKRILRYNKSTIEYGIKFTKGSSFLLGFSDADWAGSIDDRRSTGGYCIFLGDNPISWSSRKKSTVARSSTEAEYMTLAHSAAELVWVCFILNDLHFPLPVVPRLGCDNISSISLASNPI